MTGAGKPPPPCGVEAGRAVDVHPYLHPWVQVRAGLNQQA